MEAQGQLWVFDRPLRRDWLFLLGIALGIVWEVAGLVPLLSGKQMEVSRDLLGITLSIPMGILTVGVFVGTFRELARGRGLWLMRLPWPVLHAVLCISVINFYVFAGKEPAPAADLTAIIFDVCVLAFLTIFTVRARLHATHNPLARTASRAVLWSMWTGFALTLIAADAGPTARGLSHDLTWRDITNQFAWHAFDAVPGLEVPKVLGWEQPFSDYDAVTGFLLLAMRLIVLLGIIDMLRTFLNVLQDRRSNRSPAVV